MGGNTGLGFILGIMSGLFSGSFALPMKFTKKWNWENTWLMHSFWSLLIIPWVIALATVPELFSVYGATPAGVMFLVFLFGFVWGIGGVMFGIGLDIVGIALGMAIMMGMINALGSLLPLIFFNSQDIFKPVGICIIAGVLVMVAGIIACAIAGFRKEKALSASKVEEKSSAMKKPFAVGLTICILSGLFSPMLNFAFVFGDKMRESAVNLGASLTTAPNAIWSIALFGGLLVNVGYCSYRLTKNKSWKVFKVKDSGSHWIFTFLMGTIWMSSIMLYGMSAANLGKLGPSLGWPIFQGVAIIAGNVWGVVTGEWKNTGTVPIRINAAGILLLVIGMVFIGFASSL